MKDVGEPRLPSQREEASPEGRSLATRWSKKANATDLTPEELAAFIICKCISVQRLPGSGSGRDSPILSKP